jgi:ABC-2 type transport system ATP-binding protein
MPAAIETQGLTKKYRKVSALNGLDLSVPEGAIYGLVGPNGAGKTTAIKILMNIVAPTNGRASVLGLDSRKVQGRAFCSIGYVSENQKLPGWMRVGTFMAYMRGFYPTWDSALENNLLRQFDLPSDRKLKDLSRGMQMKAALASALAFRPKLIVLDEPFSGLDPLVRDELCAALQERSADATIFVSSHDLAEVETFANHIGYLDEGRLRFSEEMAALTARFREVEITFDSAASSEMSVATETVTPRPVAPQAMATQSMANGALPATWLHVNRSATSLRFVDSAFVDEHALAEFVKPLGTVSGVNVIPMSLRTIFLALAKASREVA